VRDIFKKTTDIVVDVKISCFSMIY